MRRCGRGQGWRQVEGRLSGFTGSHGGIPGSGRLFRTWRRANDRGAEPVPAAFKTFWKAFVSGPEKPWVIFSNGAFVGRPETGMPYFDPARDSRDQILEHYTGVGEVLAIHALDHTFGLLHRQLRVKRGSLLSLDDVKNNDTIFVGSPAENLTLRDIPSTHEFVFRSLESGPRKGDLAIMNIHPQSGEAEYWVGNPSQPSLVEDYAVVALVRGSIRRNPC